MYLVWYGSHIAQLHLTHTAVLTAVLVDLNRTATFDDGVV